MTPYWQQLSERHRGLRKWLPRGYCRFRVREIILESAHRRSVRDRGVGGSNPLAPTNSDPGTSSPDPLHALSRAASSARSVRVAHSLTLVRGFPEALTFPEALACLAVTDFERPYHVVIRILLTGAVVSTSD